MTLGSREHDELMQQFERQFNGHRLDRESKSDWPKQRVYQDGAVNQLFLAFRRGYALGRAIGRDSTFGE